MGHRLLQIAIAMAMTTPAAADPKRPPPKLPRFADIVRLTFTMEEGGLSAGQCTPFAQRLTIDLARARWTQELCVTGASAPKRTRQTGVLKRPHRDEIGTAYGKLVVQAGESCAKDAGAMILTLTLKGGATQRFFGDPLACPRKTGPAIAELFATFSEISSLVTTIDP